MNDRGAPATKGDIYDSAQRLEQKLLEAMRDMRIEMLKAFYNYGQTTDLKLKDGEVADFLCRQRITAVESRVTETEKRLNMPPQQPPQ